MAKSRNPIPEGMQTLTPHLTGKNASQAIEFYKKAFGATELSRQLGPGGTIMHAAMKIGDSKFFLNDPMGEFKPVDRSPVTLHLYVEDCDKLYSQAVRAGATATMPLADQFWGDRYGQLVDPYGHIWAIATHVEDLTPAEMEERKQAMASMPRR